MSFAFSSEWSLAASVIVIVDMRIYFQFLSVACALAYICRINRLQNWISHSVTSIIITMWRWRGMRKRWQPVPRWYNIGSRFDTPPALGTPSHHQGGRIMQRHWRRQQQLMSDSVAQTGRQRRRRRLLMPESHQFNSISTDLLLSTLSSFSNYNVCIINHCSRANSFSRQCPFEPPC